MAVQVSTQPAQPDNSSISWEDLYTFLSILVKRAVYSLRIAPWYGQEGDIIDDIVQQTMLRLLEQQRKIAQGQAQPIAQIDRMAAVIAFNFCRDMRRKDRRIVHSELLSSPHEAEQLVNNKESELSPDDMVEVVYQEALFHLLAQEIRQFPTKQREALLIDLANYMCFEHEPTSLQAAFQHEGISLRDYQKILPRDARERGRHTTLVYCAYKRVTHLASVQHFVSLS